MAMVEDWFWDWLPYLHGIVPRSDWPHLGDPFWLAVLASFKRNGVTLESAAEIADAMSEVPFGHLDRFIESAKAQNAAYWNRHRAQKNQLPEELRRSPSEQCKQESLDCPECSGSGFAFRHVVIKARPNAALKVELFCRCLMGRWRKANDPDLALGNKQRRKDDLQAHPELWECSLGHATWSDDPCEQDLKLGSLEQYARYVLPGEDVPRIPAEMLLRSLARKNPKVP